MKFHLDYKPLRSQTPIDHDCRLMLIGSCFSGNMGQLLLDHAFNATVNPGGIFFNPVSIGDFLERVISGKSPGDNSFLSRGESTFNFLHHSSLFAKDKPQLKKELSELYADVKKKIEALNFLFITFGTAYVYQNKTLQTVVANCHKQPQDLFEKRLLSVSEIVESYRALLNKLKTLNPKLQVIFTVSPVKHLRDGIEQNSRSKAILLLSIHEIVEKTEDSHYFPAFELVNDDLRDYRFYTADLAHPNKEAIDYIWEKFSATWFSSETRSLNEEIQKLNAAKAHRGLHANAAEEEQLKSFMEAQKKRILTRNPRLPL